MLKRCEECGYPYSSLAEKCPRCACPNPHLSKTKNLISRQEKEKDEISKSFLCFIVFLGLTWAVHTWGHLSWPLSFWIAGLASCLLVSPGSGTFIILLVISVCGFFFIDHMPAFFDEVTFYLVPGIVIYYMLIRPFIKIYRIRQNEQEIIRTHTNTNPHTSESYAHPEAEDAIDVEYTERNEEKEYEKK